MRHTFDTLSDSDQPQSFEDLDLTCPSCEADLIQDELFVSHRVCGTCNRHFSIGARERVALLVDPGSFEELRFDVVSPELVQGRDQMPTAQRLAEHHHVQVIGDAIVTGTARLGGLSTVVVVLDDHLVGTALGAIMTEKVIVALEHAKARKLPVVAICAGGPTSVQAGPLAFVQGGRLAASFSELHLERIPVVGVLTHPVSSEVFSSLAAHSDVLYSEPGAHVGLPTTGSNVPDSQRWQQAATLLADGWIDGIVDRTRLRGQLSQVIDLLANPGVARASGTTVPGGVSGSSHLADVLQHVSHEHRPTAEWFMSSLFSGLVELRGDRLTGDTDVVSCGVARAESLTVAVAALRRMPGGEGDLAMASRKLIRLARMAGRMELPLVMLVDGAVPLQDPVFRADQAYGISALRSILAVLPVPVIAVGIGVASNPLAKAMLAGDRQFMLSNALFAGIPESGPGKFPPQAKAPGRAGASGVYLTARECVGLGLVDGVIDEPSVGAYADPEGTASAVKAVLLQSLAELTGTGQRRLLDTRFRRQRNLGQSTPQGLAAARSELWELQEWQRSVVHSIDDWRERWEHLRMNSPKVSLHRPELPDLAARFRARRDVLLERRDELLERARIGDRPSGE
jgi:acetyl-CoA carboxylase carboxyl transferase subunit beta